MLMRKTWVGTVAARHEDRGISFGLYGMPSIGSLECHNGELVLLLNDEQLERHKVKVVHTDGNWRAKED